MNNNQPSIKTPELEFGYINPVSDGIVQITQILANDPVYAHIPLRRIQDIINAIYEKRYLAAVQNEICTTILLFERISREAAHQCISEKRQPKSSEVDPNGQDVLLTALSGSHTKNLIRYFIKHNKGRIILFDRHNLDKKHSSGLGWITPEGLVRRT